MKATAVSYQTHAVKDHLIRSKIVAQAFKIRVLRPISRADNSERFPVVYTTDSDDFFGGLTDMTNMLQVLGETPRFILVGIGYEDSCAARLLRMRDFCTHATRAYFQTELEQLAASPLIGGACDLDQITQTTDAKEFLQFIRVELMPFINDRYPTLPDDNNYAGYSAGGGFGLYTLFTRPDTFRRYILGSPATSHSGRHFGIELARTFVQSGLTMDAKVFMSVGELEEFDRGMCQFDLVSGYYLLAKFLVNTPICGLDLTLRVFPGETHATAWTLAFSHGLKTLFGEGGRPPFLPEYFK